MVVMKAQEWLEKKYKGQTVEEVVFKQVMIGGEDDEDIENLEGELTIDGSNITSLADIKAIKLFAAGITKLTIKGCLKVTEIDVYGNQELTEIIGLENLPELVGLNCGGTKISEIDVSKNSKLSQVHFTNNPHAKIKGFSNIIKNLTYWSSLNGIPFPWEQVLEDNLEEIVKELGIKKDEIAGKSVKEIKEIIEKKAKQLRENEEEIKNSIPDLINKDGKVDSKKLENLKKLNENQEKVVGELGKLQAENKAMRRRIEAIEGKEKLEKILSEIKAKIEVPTNKP